jgi:hypothetical protein
MENTLIGARSLGDYILINIYDDGDDTIELAPGIHFQFLSDTDFGNTRRSVDKKHPGLRPRWAIVLSTCDLAKKFGIELGDKILCDELKWSRGIPFDNSGRKIWRIPADDVLAIDKDGFQSNEIEKIAKWFEAGGQKLPSNLKRNINNE